MPDPIPQNLTCLVHGQDKYILLYDDAHKADALRQLGRWAACYELNFTWYDAAVLSQRIRGEKPAPFQQCWRISKQQKGEP